MKFNSFLWVSFLCIRIGLFLGAIMGVSYRIEGMIRNLSLSLSDGQKRKREMERIFLATSVLKYMKQSLISLYLSLLLNPIMINISFLVKLD